MKAKVSRRVSGSPRVVTSLLTVLSGLVRSGTLPMCGKWAPAVLSIADLQALATLRL